MKTMPIEACSYLRVSSTGQLSGDGYPRQREAISKFAAANGYELIAEFSDDISGKTELDNRPGLAACMERIENNGVKVVICRRVLRDLRETRWFRS
jgi:DNA invertase Pin-like site-specific DNA recombinase